jgi:hypothetical protein
MVPTTIHQRENGLPLTPASPRVARVPWGGSFAHAVARPRQQAPSSFATQSCAVPYRNEPDREFNVHYENVTCDPCTGWQKDNEVSEKKRLVAFAHHQPWCRVAGSIASPTSEHPSTEIPTMKKIVVLTAALIVMASLTGCQCGRGLFRGSRLFQRQATVVDACVPVDPCVTVDPCDPCGGCSSCGTAAGATIVPGPESYAPSIP